MFHRLGDDGAPRDELFFFDAEDRESAVAAWLCATRCVQSLPVLDDGARVISVFQRPAMYGVWNSFPVIGE